jgi:hypothetical protein
MKAGLVILALSFVAISLQCLIIDELAFDSFVLAFLNVPPQDSTTVVGAIETNDTFIGDRQLTASLMSASSGIYVASATIQGSILGCSVSTSAIGFCEFAYINLGGMDLTDCGCGTTLNFLCLFFVLFCLGCFSIVGRADFDFNLEINVTSRSNTASVGAFGDVVSVRNSLQ